MSVKSQASELNKNMVVEDEKVSPCSWHPNSYLYKGIGLIFICSIGFGSYFCYDNPGALEVLCFLKNMS